MPRQRKTLKLRDTTQQLRDDVEFLVNGEVVSYYLKLPTELGIEDFEEIGRLQKQLAEDAAEAEGSDDALASTTRIIRRMIALIFYDDVPPEVTGGLTPDRVNEIAAFLEKRWQVTETARIAPARG